MGRAIDVLLRLLAPVPPSGGVLAIAATVVAFAAGAAMACTWVLSVAPPGALAALVAVLAVLAAISTASGCRAARMLAVTPLAVFHLLWIYIVASLGALLAWTTPEWVRWLAALLAAAAIAGAILPRARFRLPTAVPLGFWILACLIGWQREDGVVRCDDYLAVRTSPASVLVPTSAELERCRPGEVLRTGHYPRRLWEAPSGERLVMTTQLGIGKLSPPGRQVADRFPGTVCDVPLRGEPTCFGGGKAQAIVESQGRDLLFVAGWQQDLVAGKNGVLYVLPTAAPLEPLAVLHFEENVAELFYDPASDTVGLFSDEARVMRPVHIAHRTILDPVPAPIVPGETRYDEDRGEGVICFGAGPIKRLDGEPFLSVAFRGNPFAMRALGSGGDNPLAWLSMVWGCDWDPKSRLVYVANASLGLLEIVDYDTGEILRRLPVEFGIRYVTLDAERNLLYLANFLRGDIVAVTADQGREVARWFAGRFVRHVTLRRDRRSLLATSNLGVVEIPLDSDLHRPAALFGVRQMRWSSQ